MTKDPDLMDKILSLSKRRGFIFPSSEIYGGLAGFWDYGPLGAALKENVRRAWWKRFVENRNDIYGMDASIIMNKNVWVATGHATAFTDPLVECSKCKKRFRADQIQTNAEDKKMMEKLIRDGLKYESEEIFDSNKNYIYWVCDVCNTKNYGSKPRQFNMMFQTRIGTTEDENSISYLRPETAQGMFVNFKNLLDSMHPKMPFGMAQVGKAFRNEIAPRDFLFRAREFEQMEIEYFVNPKDWKKSFEEFVPEIHAFNEDIGIPKNKVHENEILEKERAFYSKRTIDFEFDFPFGRKELYGLAYRTDYDLDRHEKQSGVVLRYSDEEDKTPFIPHCIEPSFGLDRAILAVMASAYAEEKISDEDQRIVMRFSVNIAPVLMAVSPLLRNKPALVKKAREIYKSLKEKFGRVI